MKKFTLFDKDIIYETLVNHGLLKLEGNDNLSFFRTNFNKDSDFLKIWRSEERHKKGIYIFKQEEKIMYIGKAESMIGRLSAHFREASLEHKSAPVFWCYFFNHMVNRGSVDIITFPVEEELERIVLEKWLQNHHIPVFDNLKKDFLKKNNGKNPKFSNAQENDIRMCKLILDEYFNN